MDSLTRRARATPRVSLRGGRLYWQPSRSLRAQGFRGRPLGPLGRDALDAADALNADADARGADRPAPATVAALVARYRASEAFACLAPRTAADRGRHLTVLAGRFGGCAADRLAGPELRRWHEARAARAPATARATLKSARILFRWAGGADPTAGIAAGGSRRRLRVATREELAAMIDALDNMGARHVASLALAACTLAQRPGDARALRWRNLRDGRAVIVQSKTGATVRPRVHPALAARIGAEGPPGAALFPGPDGGPMAEHHAARAWRAARAAAARAVPSLGGCADAVDPEARGPLELRDMRRTGMVWMALGGADVPAIVSVSGHSLTEGHAILEHYLPRTRALADMATAALPGLGAP